MKSAPLRTLPLAPRTRAEASRSKAAPGGERASQPRPTTMSVRPGACLVSDTLPPLLREMGIGVLRGFGEATPRTVRGSGAEDARPSGGHGASTRPAAPHQWGTLIIAATGRLIRCGP